FQMSFAATTALVAVFGWIRDMEWKLGPKWLQPVLGVVISSAVAGLATAPIGAAHFNTMAHYGLIANLASVPLMGMLVIPAAVLALLLAPFGLEAVGLWLMGLGLRWILWVADTVSGLDGAQGFVAGPHALVLPLIALGMLFVILWQGRARFAGLPIVLLGLALWQVNARPAILVADTGGLVGRLTEEGRALSREKGAGFVARNWLENDGEGIDQAVAAARWDRAQDFKITHLSGKRAAASFSGCSKGELVVSNTELTAPNPSPCLILTPSVLRKTGAVALFEKGGTLHLKTARDIAGDRMWSGWSGSTPPKLVINGQSANLIVRNEVGDP
ncbi:MAG: ComEC/Rec2 family competence protein, partial [Ruegeria sp.]